jgi:hypothetical protein
MSTFHVAGQHNSSLTAASIIVPVSLSAASLLCAASGRMQLAAPDGATRTEMVPTCGPAGADMPGPSNGSPIPLRDYGTDCGARHSVAVWGVITMCAACDSP